MTTLVFMMTVLVQAASAHSAHPGPLVSNFGKVYKIEDLQVPLNTTSTQKVLFDIYKTADTPNELNRRLDGVARFLNMHVLHGLDPKKIQIAVVLHGSATRDGLKNAAYKKKYKVENPNLLLIQALSRHGVKLYQCGQSAYHHGYNAKDYLKPVRLALSAMTMLTELQNAGYALLPW